MSTFCTEDYGPVLARFLAIDRARPLDDRPDFGPGGGPGGILAPPQLAEMDIEDALEGRRVADRQAAACCLGGIWLLYDELDQSHQISQGVKTSSGSFWHGIMHRREGDFSNAKYWFRNVGDHPVYEPLAAEARRLATEPGDRARIEPFADSDWDPFAFVDACQAAIRRGAADEKLLVAIQQREWELLFDYCFRQAIGE